MKIEYYHAPCEINLITNPCSHCEYNSNDICTYNHDNPDVIDYREDFIDKNNKVIYTPEDEIDDEDEKFTNEALKVYAEIVKCHEKIMLLEEEADKYKERLEYITDKYRANKFRNIDYEEFAKKVSGGWLAYLENVKK